MGWRTRLGLDLPSDTEEFSDPAYSLSDPYLQDVFTGWMGTTSTGLPSVTESDALGIPAFSRGVELIAGTIAGLPLRGYRENADGTRQDVPSVLDNPQGPYAISKYQWTEMVVYHLVVYRECFLLHVYNGFGVLVGFWPIHPNAVTKVEWVGPRKRFTVGDNTRGQETYDDTQITHIVGPNAYGLRGVPLFRSHRKVFQTSIAGEQAAGRSFTGAMVRGMVTTDVDENIDAETAMDIKEKLDAKISGASNTGQIAFVNAHLKFTPWYQTNADAQFIESRQYQNEEFARMLGLPPHLLAMVDKATSWGTGIAEQNIGLARYCLTAYTSRIESALSPLLDPVYPEFDYKGLLQGSPAQEIDLLLKEVGGPILDVDEARAKLNLGPMPAQPAPEAVPNGTQG